MTENKPNQSDLPDDLTRSSEALPEELEEALKSLPPDESGQLIRSFVLSMSRSSVSHSSPISKQINAGHIDKLIANDDKEDERQHQRSQSQQITNRLGIGAVILLVIIVLTYAGITKRESLAEKIIIASISGVGGLGAGIAIGKRKD